VLHCSPVAHYIVRSVLLVLLTTVRRFSLTRAVKRARCAHSPAARLARSARSGRCWRTTASAQVVEVEQTAMCLFKTVRTRMIVHQARSLRTPSRRLLRAGLPEVACEWRALRQEAHSPESLALLLLGLQRCCVCVLQSIAQQAHQRAQRRRRTAAGMSSGLLRNTLRQLCTRCTSTSTHSHTTRCPWTAAGRASAPADGSRSCAQDAEPLDDSSAVGVPPAPGSGARPSRRMHSVTPGAPLQDRRARTVEFRLARQGAMRSFEGRWTVTPCGGGGSTVVLEQRMQPAFVPPPPFRRFLRRALLGKAAHMLRDMQARRAPAQLLPRCPGSRAPAGPCFYSGDAP